MERTLPRPLDWHWMLPWVGVLVTYWLLAPVLTGSDAMDYYLMDPSDPYANEWGAVHAFVYSPAYAQVLTPLQALPFEWFYKLLLAVNLGALVYLLGPVWGVVALPFAIPDISNGQIHLLLAASVVAMVRTPGWAAFGLLSKVTPGVTVLWFLARREWRNLGIAVGVTAGIVGVSAVVYPTAWVEWVELLTTSSTRHVENFSVSEWPAIFRLPIAAGLVIMAGWRDRPAALPVIALFALPTIWAGALVMLLAVPKLYANISTT